MPESASQRVYLVPGGGVPGLRGGYLVQGVPDLGGVTGSGGGVCSKGGCLLQGEGGVCSRGRGVSAPGGCLLVRYPPPVNRMTNRCKNITLPQTSFAGGNNAIRYIKFL